MNIEKQYDCIWDHVRDDYILEGELGQGAYATVVKAKCKLTGRQVAIKLIHNIFLSKHSMKNTLRELQLMHELTKMDGNSFTTKMLDVILPVRNEQDLNSFKSIFIVMNCVKRDLDSLLQKIKPNNFSEKHSLKIVYNILCCMNFLQTANVIHRDIKPNNILIKDDCRVVICDFGFARTMPLDLDDS